MSALDMFCSALGAFMFLALLFFPFAPNLGPESKQLDRLEKQIADLRDKLQQVTSERDASAAKLHAQAVEVAIVIDTTASMDRPITGLRNQIGDFAQVISRLSGDAQIAIVDYKDNEGCPGQNSIRTLPLTRVDAAGLAQIQAYANALRAEVPQGCNTTPPEDVADGVRAAVRLNWTAPPDGRFIVVIGDNPPHNQTETEQALSDARAWGAASSKMSTLLFPDPNPATDMTAAETFYQQLADAGHGTRGNPGDSFALALLRMMTQ